MTDSQDPVKVKSLKGRQQMQLREEQNEVDKDVDKRANSENMKTEEIKRK